MGLIIPERRSIVATLQSYIRANVPGLDPTTNRRSYIGGIVKSFGSALHDWYVALKKYGDHEPFPQTATTDFLYKGWWRDITKLDRNPAAPARGSLVFTGTAGTLVPDGLELIANANAYTVDAPASIVTQTLSIAILTRDGSTAIAETAEPHFLASGMTVIISGATQADYNGSAIITVTAGNEFTFDVHGSPVTPATGTPILTATWAVASVTAETTGPESNIDAAGLLQIVSPPVGMDSTAIATFGGLADGSDIENEESYRERVLEALGSDFGTFTGDEIAIIARQVPGVTRVWVRKATLNGTNGVLEGQVKVGFLREGDANPFPSAQEVEAVKDRILALSMPAHTAPEDVIVVSPTPKYVPFTVAVTPNTASMRAAVRASLAQLFDESVEWGEPVGEDAYRCAIRDAYDPITRQRLKGFSLATPSGDVSVTSDELAQLGTLTFTA